MNYEPVEKPPSKYSIEDIDNGARITRECGLSCDVTYKADTAHIQLGNYSYEGLYTYPKIMEGIGFFFANKLIKGKDRIRRDAAATIARCLSKRFKPHWERIVKELAPPEVEQLARLMFSSVYGDCELLHVPALYEAENRYIRSDLINYRAARIIAKRLERIYIVNREYILRDMQSWRDTIAHGGKSFKALNKTLDALPTNISFHQIERLVHIPFDRPITNRLHLVFLMGVANHHNFTLHIRTVLNSNETEIKQALEAIGYPNITSRSRTNWIESGARTILDYPCAYGGNLAGLARLSQRWHREMERRNPYDMPFDENYQDAELPKPEVDLEALAEKGVHFLGSVSALYEEGQVMKHCIPSYATKALRGACYLFHVEYEGETASIEVAPSGEIVQAKGERNSYNTACIYGESVLRTAFFKLNNFGIGKVLGTE